MSGVVDDGSPPPPASTQKTGGGFGDFQENVGKLGATFNEIGAWIAFGICALISVTMLVNALKDDHLRPDKNKAEDALLALIPVGIGLLIVVLAHAWRKVVSHNRGAAQFAGLMTEGNMLSNILH
jgi:putative Mn2+ efflux pump MntP